MTSRRGAATAARRFALALACATLIFAGCNSSSEKSAHKKSQTAITNNNGRAVEYANPMVVQEHPASSGKRSSASAAQAHSSEDALNDCAERLHSLCGPLLFYYMENHHLPPTLQDLPSDSPEPLPPLMCPESHKPYVYLPKYAIPIDNPRGLIIVHDPVPAHDGVRWCVVVSVGNSATEPLIVKSVGIREDRFAVLRTRALTEQQQMQREQQQQQSQQAPPSKQ